MPGPESREDAVDSASPLLFHGQPGSAGEDFPGVLWARSGAGGQAGGPGPGAWALIQSGIISEYLCGWGVVRRVKPPLEATASCNFLGRVF